VDTLPILLSIPHGGNQTPVELKDRLRIGQEAILEDADGFTQEIYDLKEKVQFVIKADIARAFVDQSRSASDLPPDNPDGVIKSHTCFGKIIYKQDQQPNKSETTLLLEKYYYPYHQQLQDITQRERNVIKICLDCHSMAETGPPISPDIGKERPLFCLGNRFGESASDELIHRLKSCLVNAFELDDTEVAINKPFAGGFITKHYGNNPLPWIQIEMNRKLYLKQPWFNFETLTISSDKTSDLSRRFYRALKIFFS